MLHFQSARPIKDVTIFDRSLGKLSAAARLYSSLATSVYCAVRHPAMGQRRLLAAAFLWCRFYSKEYTMWTVTDTLSFPSIMGVEGAASPAKLYL